LWLLLSAAPGALLAPGTSPAATAAFRTNDITDAGFAIRSFELTDHSGRTRTLAGFKGKVNTGTGGNYSVDHSTHSYVFGTDGRLRLFLRMGVAATDIEHGLRLLLAEQQ